MENIGNSKLIWLKGCLFLLVGIASSVLLLFEAPTLRVGLLLTLTIWGFCRAYYFAFYVIERYVDPNYRFSGLISLIIYTLQKR